MDKRRKPRVQRRLSCELWIAGKRHTGIVRDVSESGIYVQTRVRASTGEKIELVFAASAGKPAVRVRTRVARLDRVAGHFAVQGAGGLGLEVVEPAGGLGPLLAGAGFTGGPPTPVADATRRGPGELAR